LPTSAADFCCHEHPLDPQLPSVRLTPLYPPQPASCLRWRLRASDDTKLSTTTPDSRCRHLRPWVATQLTLRPPAAATFTVPRKALDFPNVNPRQRFSAEHEPDEATTDAPCHNLGFVWFPSRFQESQDPLPFHLVTGACSTGSRASSTDRSRRALLLTHVQSISLRAATGTLALPPIGPASDTRSRTFLRARPKHLPGYSPESSGHVPPADFCSRRPTSTPPSCPNLLAFLRWRTIALGVAASLAGHCQPGFQRPGGALR
jgi:hypothetical protein